MIKNKIIGLLLIVISIIIPIFNNYQKEEKQTINKEQVAIYLNETTNNKKNITTKKVASSKYIAILEIPSINLKKGLVDIENSLNNVKYNIEIINGSSMPNVIGSNLVLASHNGNSNVSFFKNLDKLDTSSLVYIYYEGIKYIYQISSINVVPKTGEIKITRDKLRNAITLITCKKNSNTKQVIYLGYLIDQETY